MLRLRFGVAACVAGSAAAGGILLAACGSLNGGANPESGFEDSGSSYDGTTGDAPVSGQDAAALVDSGADVGTAPPRPTQAIFVHASPDLPDLRLCWWISNGAPMTGGGGATANDAGTDAGDGGETTASDAGANESGSDASIGDTGSDTNADDAGDDAGEQPTEDAGGPGDTPPFPSGAPAPMSDYPAIPIGGDVPLPDASSLLGGDLTVVAINAGALAGYEPPGTPSYPCSEVLGGGSQHVDTDILYTFVIPAGAILYGATNIVAIGGCYKGDVSIDPTRCGAGFSPSTGNVHADVIQLMNFDRPEAGQFAAQTALLSAGVAATAGNAGTVVSYGPEDAAAPVATLVGEGALAPSAPVLLNAAMTPTDYGRLGFALDFAPAGGGATHTWLSLEQMLALIDPTIDPAVFYKQPTPYVVAVVGDTAGVPPFSPDAGTYDGTGLHLLVMPLP